MSEIYFTLSEDAKAGDRLEVDESTGLLKKRKSYAKLGSKEVFDEDEIRRILRDELRNILR